MTRVTGVGGAFLRAADPEKLYTWYEQQLGIKRTEDGAIVFFSEGPREMTILAFFPQNTDYFGSGTQQVMINLRVENLDELVNKLSAAGVPVDPKREDHEYGRFAWVTDPEGNRVELWEPPAASEE